MKSAQDLTTRRPDDRSRRSSKLHRVSWFSTFLGVLMQQIFNNHTGSTFWGSSTRKKLDAWRTRTSLPLRDYICIVPPGLGTGSCLSFFFVETRVVAGRIMHDLVV